MGKIRLFKATTHYKAFIDSIYERYPDLSQQSYQTQMDKILSYKFATADFWKINLEARGDFEVQEILFEVEPLQKKWAEENNVAYGDNWIWDILIAQAKQFEPQIVMYYQIGTLQGDFKRKLKSEVKSAEVHISLDGVAHKDAKLFEEVDIMFSCLDFIADYYKQQGFHSLYLPFGFETTLLDQLTLWDRKYETTFVGSFNVRMNSGHYTRKELVKFVNSKTDIDLFINNEDLKHWQPWRWPQRQRIFSGKFQEMIDVWQLGRNNHEARFGIDMYQLLANSRMTLNMHIDAAGPKAANMRLFEATGAGTCLVTDWKENIGDFFEEDYEVVTYKSKEECVEKIKWLQNNPEKCEEIARAGHKKTIEQHSMKAHLDKLVNFIFDKYPHLKA